MTVYKTRYGPVYHREKCKSDWRNIVTVDHKKPWTRYTLQRPAVKSLHAVARDLGSFWKPQWVRVTGTHRTCSFQLSKWREDPSRFASPNGTLHTHGLAIDVHTGFLNEKIRKSLLRHGWHQSRPDDEPWHFSFRLKA